MSHIATTWAYRQDIDSGPKFVLVALADFADEAGTCFPGQERIAAMTGMHRSSVVRHLKALESMGLISRVHRQGPKGQRTSDRYALALTAYVAASNVANSNVGDSNVASAPGPMSQSAQNQRRNLRQEPSVEPPVTRQEDLSTRRKPLTAIPDDWRPHDLHREQALAKGLDVDTEAEAFRNHAESVDRRLADWNAGFRNWLTKAQTRARDRTTTRDRYEQGMAVVQRLEAKERQTTLDMPQIGAR